MYADGGDSDDDDDDLWCWELVAPDEARFGWASVAGPRLGSVHKLGTHPIEAQLILFAIKSRRKESTVKHRNIDDICLQLRPASSFAPFDFWNLEEESPRIPSGLFCLADVCWNNSTRRQQQQQSAVSLRRWWIPIGENNEPAQMDCCNVRPAAAGGQRGRPCSLGPLHW